MKSEARWLTEKMLTKFNGSSSSGSSSRRRDGGIHDMWDVVYTSRIVQLRTSTASCNMTRLITPTASIDHLSLLLYNQKTV